MPQKPAHPVLVYGAGNLGAWWGGPGTTAKGLPSTLDALRRLGIKRIDTAATYPPGGEPGESERLLGGAGAASPGSGLAVDTKLDFEKVQRTEENAGTRGELYGTADAYTPQKVGKSAEASLARLRADAVNVLYCHVPDTSTPIEVQVEALEEQRRLGRCKEIGICNFSPEMTEEWVSVCKQKGYKLPAVYQGQYNLMFREFESSIFPVLRKHGIAFFAYSPLAGGFLSGKFTSGNVEENSRFTADGWLKDLFRGDVDRQELHAAVVSLQDLLKARGIGPTGGALRWICYHSSLKPELGDGIVLGASSVEQLEQNAADVEAGPLPADIVQGIKDIWETICSFRSASKA